MKKIVLSAAIFSSVALLNSCSSTEQKTDLTEGVEVTEVAEEEVKEETLIKLTPFPDSPEYADAMLELNTPNDGDALEIGEVTFDFNVKNYELGTQTGDADAKMCANSAKGQHIHLIVNNEPYSAHYEPEIKKEMAEGSYTALAFISRSYHESIKNPEAYILRNFTVGNAEENTVDLTAPHMFYSRPKGTYNGPDAQKVMLDFYLVNTDLSADGNKVRATINGEEFMIDTWKPHFIEGMPMGTNTVKLELLDAEGNLVNSPFNPVERTIELTDLQ